MTIYHIAQSSGNEESVSIDDIMLPILDKLTELRCNLRTENADCVAITTLLGLKEGNNSRTSSGESTARSFSKSSNYNYCFKIGKGESFVWG